MLFNSWGYILLFLLLGTTGYWLLPHKYRVYFLCFGGILFYCMWRWEFILLILFSPSLDYICASKVYHSTSQRERKIWLFSTLFINIGLLVYFKYTYFIYDSFQSLCNAAGFFPPELALQIILPLGISFYTFHSISYTLDVYRGTITPVKSYLTFLTYVTFWPQLMAGPILRPKEVLSQLEQKKVFQPQNFTAGLERIITGFFKKVVIADNLAGLVDVAFGYDPHLLTGYDVWVAAFLFGFQIYFDFAGYSDIAIGSAKLLGINFPENFSWPYLAASPKEFWKRWHISLSSWIRDYLYLPLTGQKFKTHSTGGIAEAAEQSKGAPNYTFALFLTWFIMGLWHGAAWTFALWGLLHASFVFLYRKITLFSLLERKAVVVSWFITLLLSMVAWIPFRATSLEQTFVMFCKLANPSEYVFSMHILTSREYLTAALLMLAMLLLYALKQRLGNNREHALFLVAKYLAMAVMVAFTITYLENETQFIYFQF